MLHLGCCSSPRFTSDVCNALKIGGKRLSQMRKSIFLKDSNLQNMSTSAKIQVRNNFSSMLTSTKTTATGIKMGSKLHILETTSFRLFTACVLYNNGKISISLTKEASIKSRITSASCVDLLMKYLCALLDKELHILGQMQSTFPFAMCLLHTQTISEGR